MFISKGCLITILDNLSVLNKETEELKKKVADLEGQVQGQLEVKIDVDTIQKALKKMERFAPVINIPPIRQE